MLVLTRKVQEQIQIGNDITITILRVKGQAVRVGIEAPREISVMRSEIREDAAQSEHTPATPRRAKLRIPRPATMKSDSPSQRTTPVREDRPVIGTIPASFANMSASKGPAPLRSLVSGRLAARGIAAPVR